MKGMNAIGKAIVWILLCLVPIFIFVVSFFVSYAVGKQSVSGWTMILLFLLNPLYLASVSYGYINKKSIVIMYIALVLPQILLCIPYLARTNNDWFAIAKTEFYAGLYQIIGITICFSVACLIKYLVQKHNMREKTDEFAENKAEYEDKITPFIKWLLLSIVLPGVFFWVILVAMLIGVSTGDKAFDISVFVLLAYVVIYPIYTSLISYKFISFAKAAYMYLSLILSQSFWLVFLWIDKEDGFFGKIWMYQIIGITICFGVACLLKYLVHRRKAKKAINAVPEEE